LFTLNLFQESKNKKGKDLFDLEATECRGSSVDAAIGAIVESNPSNFINRENLNLEKIKTFFPNDYKDKLPLLLKDASPQKFKQITAAIDYKDFNFLNPDGEFVFNFVPEDSENGRFINNKFEQEIIRSAESNGTNLKWLGLYTDKKPEILLARNEEGKSVLEIVRSSNPMEYISLSRNLGIQVLRDLESGKDSPRLWEYLKNGNVAESRGPLFSVVNNLKDESLKSKIYSEFNLNVDGASSNIVDLTELIRKTDETISEDDFMRLSYETCDVISAYDSTISCDDFVKGQILQRKKSDVASSLGITLVNLIDQATLAGQGSSAYLLLNQLAKINKQLADHILEKMNLKNSIMSDDDYKAFKPILISKIKLGELDCSPTRYRFREFIGNNITKIAEYGNKVSACAKSGETKEELHFVGVTKDNQPVLTIETFREVVEREIQPHKESATRAYQLLRNGDYLGSLSESYELFNTGIDAKLITKSTALKSYITGQDVKECQGLCNSLFLINTGINTSQMISTLKSDTANAGVASLLLVSFFPQSKNVIGMGGTLLGLLRGTTNFLLDTVSESYDWRDCRADCEVENQLRSNDTFSKIIKERKKIFEKMQAQDDLVGSVFTNYKSVEQLGMLYPDHDEVKKLKEAFFNSLRSSLQNKEDLDQMYSKFAKMNVKDAVEMEKLGNDLIKRREILLSELAAITNNYRTKMTGLKPKNSKKEIIQISIHYR